MWSWFRDQDVQEPCLAAGQAQVLNPCHHLQITLWSHSTPFFHLFISSIISSPFHHLPIILSSFWRQALSKLSQLVIKLLSNCHQAIVKLSSGEFSGGWCQDGWEGAPGGHLRGTWARVGRSRREAPHCLSVPHYSLLGYCFSRLCEHNIHNLHGHVSHVRWIKTCSCDTHDQTGLMDCRSKVTIFLLC